jgi:hypothetical protein
MFNQRALVSLSIFLPSIQHHSPPFSSINFFLLWSTPYFNSTSCTACDLIVKLLFILLQVVSILHWTGVGLSSTF